MELDTSVTPFDEGGGKRLYFPRKHLKSFGIKSTTHLEITLCQRMHKETFNKRWIILLKVEDLTEETYFAGESEPVFRGSEIRDQREML